MNRWCARAVVWIALVALAPAAQAQVVFEWAVIGDPGNPCDEGTHGCLGALEQTVGVARFEVTNTDYAAFLNAVASSDDANDLYSVEMTDDEEHGGIERSGDGPFSYAAKAGMEAQPVNYVSYWDALRFTNWLHNGQPLGPQDATTTEDGAYTLTPAGVAANSIVRNATARYAVTNEDEWYKAAYYDFAGGYYLYPTASDVEPECTVPGPAADIANCGFVGAATDVGSYPGSATVRGTFDQGGNVREWTGHIIGGTRTLRGGAYNSGSAQLASTVRWAVAPESEVSVVGFRVANLELDVMPVPALGGAGAGALVLLLSVTARWKLERSGPEPRRSA